MSEAGTADLRSPDDHDETANPAVPSTEEGLLADRQVLWGGFTKLILWSIIGVVVILVLLDWALL